MNGFVLKVGEMFGLFKKIQLFLKGKKTILSSLGGMFAAMGLIVGHVVRWANGEIDVSQCWNDCQAPGIVFWTAVTFLWSAMHSKTIAVSEIGKKIGPGF